MLKLDELVRPKFDVRSEYDRQHVENLAKTIMQKGLIQPIVVRKVNDKYEVIAGVHRVLAYECLQRDEIPAIVLDDVNDIDAIILRTIENVHRKSLNPFEIARVAKELHDNYGMSYDDIAELLAINRSTLYGFLDMNEYLTEEEKKKVLKGEIKRREAIAMARERKEVEAELEPCAICGNLTKKEHLMLVKICPSCLEIAKAARGE